MSVPTSSPHDPPHPTKWSTFVRNLSIMGSSKSLTSRRSWPVQVLGQRIRPRFWAVEQPVDLNQISATTHYGCMGLPQELVDYIMDMLHDNTPALKVCSLTCKAMFASTRRLIHRSLQLTLENTLRVLTRAEKRRYRRGNRDVELGFVPFMGELGLLQYARWVNICMPDPFTPEILLPHLRHFQSLNRVHTLTIDHCCTNKWVNYHTTCFAHFYPTLTSLTLSHPCGHDQLLHFALQFPNLENLSLEWLGFDREFESGLIDVATPERSPPLRGCLRLVGYGTLVQLSTGLFGEPPKGFNFRSVELENFPGNHAQRALTACAQTLENLTITAYILGVLRLPSSRWL